MTLQERFTQRVRQLADNPVTQKVVDFDLRRNIVDDIEAMLERAGAFRVEVYVLDEDGTPVQTDEDLGAELDSRDLRALAEDLADYILKGQDL